MRESPTKATRFLARQVLASLQNKKKTKQIKKNKTKHKEQFERHSPQRLQSANIQETAGSPRISSEAHNGTHYLCDPVAT